MTSIRHRRILVLVMEFIESPIFTKLISKYLSDEEYSVLQWELLSQPNAGAITPGSGGLKAQMES